MYGFIVIEDCITTISALSGITAKISLKNKTVDQLNMHNLSEIANYNYEFSLEALYLWCYNEATSNTYIV